MTPAYFLAARTPVHEDGGRDHDAPLAHSVLCDTGFNSSSGILRSWTVYEMGTTCTGQYKETGNVLPKEVQFQIHQGSRAHLCGRFEDQCTGATIVPTENEECQWATVPDEASCRIIRTFFVTVNQEQSDKTVPILARSISTTKDAKMPLGCSGKKQFQQRIPHVVCEVVVNTRYGRGG